MLHLKARHKNFYLNKLSISFLLSKHDYNLLKDVLFFILIQGPFLIDILLQIIIVFLNTCTDYLGLCSVNSDELSPLLPGPI